MKIFFVSICIFFLLLISLIGLAINMTVQPPLSVDPAYNDSMPCSKQVFSPGIISRI